MVRKRAMLFPSDATYFWTFLHFAARFIVDPILCTIEVHNQEHVPRQGGCIVASNHTMGPDYVLLGYAASRQFITWQKANCLRSTHDSLVFCMQLVHFPYNVVKRSQCPAISSGPN